MITFQDFQEYAMGNTEFIPHAIAEHRASRLFQTALEADAYDHQRNTRIMNFTKALFTKGGARIVDPTSTMIPIPCNLFHRLNTQRCQYSLGNGVEFEGKERFGEDFDNTFETAGYYALIHGVSFLYWATDSLYCFPVTQFVPLWDETTGNLGAGVRFWQLAPDKPLYATLYEKDGYTPYKIEDGDTSEIKPKQSYKVKVRTTPQGEEIVGAENYSDIPIIPLYGSKLQQSTLVGIKGAIDNYDMVKSGYADNVSQCAQVYWIVDNCGGMTDKDFNEFRQNLLFRHMANVDAESGVKITPYTNNPPHEANDACLAVLRAGIYEDFGALDVTSISAAAKTATEINAAYQPMDENADDYEYQLIKALLMLQRLLGLKENVPEFKRNRVANLKEQVEVVMLEANYLDDETVLRKLPNITVDEVEEILKRKDAEATKRFVDKEPEEETEEDEEEPEEEPEEDEE